MMISCEVGREGIEPPTSCLSGKRSQPLSYRPMRRTSVAIATLISSTILGPGSSVHTFFSPATFLFLMDASTSSHSERSSYEK